MAGLTTKRNVQLPRKPDILVNIKLWTLQINLSALIHLDNDQIQIKAAAFSVHSALLIRLQSQCFSDQTDFEYTA
jgi:hypothetical protein